MPGVGRGDNLAVPRECLSGLPSCWSVAFPNQGSEDGADLHLGAGTNQITTASFAYDSDGNITQDGNALGSPLTITNSSGNPCYVATYTPY